MSKKTLTIIMGICYAGLIVALCTFFEKSFLPKYQDDQTLLLILRWLFYPLLLAMSYILTYLNFFKRHKSKEPCPKCGEYQFFQTGSKLEGQNKKYGKGKVLCFYKCKACDYQMKRPETY